MWINRKSQKCLHVATGVNLTRVDQQPCNTEDQGQRWFWRTADVVGCLVLNSDFPDMCLSLVAAPPRATLVRTHVIVPAFCRDLGRRLRRGEEVVGQRRGA